MKTKFYEKPSIEVVEIEIEGSILQPTTSDLVDQLNPYPYDENW